MAEPPPIRARHAASLVVLRQDGPVPAMLMGVRGAGHRFMPHTLVFPGGGVDPGDASAPAASELPPHVHALMARGAPDRLVRAIAIAAARELEEETGLSLGQAPGQPSLAGLDYIGRLITPRESPIRFNARFLTIDAAHVTGTLAGSGELEDLRWLTIPAAVEAGLARPTRLVVTLLQDWLAMSPAARQARATVPVLQNRRLLTE